MLKLVLSLVVVAAAAAGMAQLDDSQSAARGKKLIEYGWDVPTPAQMRDNLAAMEQRPFDGIIFRLAGGFNAFVRGPLDHAKFAEDEKVLRDLKFNRFKENFVLVWGTADKDWDWFDDASWRTVESNARLLARVARSGRIRGICFDPEPYDFNPWEYAKQKGAGGRSFEEFQRKVRGRGAGFMRALEKEIPSPVILTFFHLSLFGSVMDEPAPAVRAERLKGQGWGLMADFLIGMLEAASPRTKFVDGNEMAYYYEGREPFFRAYHTIRRRAPGLVPEGMRTKYLRQVEAGQALYVDHLFALRQPNTDRYLSYRLTPEERARWFEHNAYWALYTSDEYVWCYSERMNWWKGDVPPGLEEALVRARRKYDEGKPLGFDIEPMLREAAKRPVP